MSVKVETILKMYTAGKINDAAIEKYVSKGVITREEADMIKALK